MFTRKFKDIDIQILLYLNDKDLCSCFRANRYTLSLSNNENFWIRLVMKKYGFHLGSCENVREKYLNGRSWKDYYMLYVGSKYYSYSTLQYFSRGRGICVGLSTRKTDKLQIFSHYNRGGKLDGMLEEFRENEEKEKIVENYKNGQKHGFRRVWRNEILISEEYYDMDYKSGNWKMWHNNGVLKSSHNYINNKPNGIILGWFSNGQKQYEREFVSNKLIKDLRWDERGNPRKIDENCKEYVLINNLWEEINN